MCPKVYFFFQAKRKCVMLFFHKGVCVCVCRPTERERTERLIKTRLREIMMQKDLENVTCKEVRGTHMNTVMYTDTSRFCKCSFTC